MSLVIGENYQLVEKMDFGSKLDYCFQAIKSGEKVLVKMIEKSRHGFESELKEAVYEEANVLKGCESASLPKFFDIIETEDYIAEILEYTEGKTLFQYMQEMGALTEQEAIRLINEVIKTLLYLKNMGYTYANGFIGPDNVIVRPEGHISLVSLGFIERSARMAVSKKIYSEDYLVEYLPDRFEAPEMAATRVWYPGISLEDFINERSDVYTVGAILYYMLVETDLSTPPYTLEPLYGVKSGIAKPLETIIKHCINKSPKKRFKTLRDLDKALNSKCLRAKIRRM